MWHPCWTVSATELIFFRWNIEQAAVARRQMPAVEYSTRLLVSSVFPGNIWVWPFLFIDWRLFLFPRAAKRRLRSATGGCDLTFSSEPGSQRREWEVWHVLAYYPSAHLSWQNKVMEGRLHQWRIAASTHVKKKRNWKFCSVWSCEELVEFCLFVHSFIFYSCCQID